MQIKDTNFLPVQSCHRLVIRYLDLLGRVISRVHREDLCVQARNTPEIKATKELRMRSVKL